MKIKHILLALLTLLLIAVLCWLSEVSRVLIRMSDDLDLGDNYAYCQDAQCLTLNRNVIFSPIRVTEYNYDESYIILQWHWYDYYNRDTSYIIVRKLDYNADSLELSYNLETFQTKEEFDSVLAKRGISLQLKPIIPYE